MRTVFFDVDTQYDFLLPTGALPVPNAARIIGALAKLNHFARERGIPLISTVDAHAEDDVEFKTWPAHCVSGTLGQRKPEATLAGQIILEKQTLDSFAAPALPGILKQFSAQRYIVYGVVTEICVRYAIRGLHRTGARVDLVTDATQSLDSRAAEETCQEVSAHGGVLTTLDRVLALGDF